MVGTIAPVVYRNSELDWRVAATIYTIGSIVGGSLVGVIIGLVASLLPRSLYFDSIPLLIGFAAFGYSLHEMHILALPHPQRRRQVSKDWRLRFHPYITAGLFGLLLGAGFTTFIPTASYYFIWLPAILYGSPVLAVILFGIYGASRASLLWPFCQWAASFELMRRLGRQIDLTKPIMRQVNGFALAMLAAYLISAYLSIT